MLESFQSVQAYRDLQKTAQKSLPYASYVHVFNTSELQALNDWSFKNERNAFICRVTNTTRVARKPGKKRVKITFSKNLQPICPKDVPSQA